MYLRLLSLPPTALPAVRSHLPSVGVLLFISELFSYVFQIIPILCPRTPQYEALKTLQACRHMFLAVVRVLWRM
jgi:hypothetical protein